MTVQTTYNNAPLEGYPGQIAHIGGPIDIKTFWSEGTNHAGRGVIKGTVTTAVANDYQDRHIPFGVKVPGSSGDTLVGLAIRQVALPNDSNGLPYYADESLVSVLMQGAMYANNKEAVAALDPVYVVYDVGDSGLAVGDLIKDAVAGTTGAAIQLAGAYWHTAAAANGISIVVMTKNPLV